MQEIVIDGTPISQSDPCFIIAELSANHAGSKEIALETIRAAKRAGADCIKLQTYTPDTITLNCDKEDFVINQKTVWDGKKLYDLYEEAHTLWEWHVDLFAEAKRLDLICFSSPFDNSAVDFLETLNVPAYKIASFEITDIPLIEYVASKGKPLIISTGIAELEDIELAIEACHKQGNQQIILLNCTSAYPSPIEDSNLKMIADMSERFNVITGLSDHTLGNTAAIASVALGAKVIEKHLILNKSVDSLDSSFSLDEKEFTSLVKTVREAEKALGKVDYELNENGKRSKQFSRSLYISEDVKQGDLITNQNVRSVRPGFGLHPKYLKDVIGKKFKEDYSKGTRLSFKLIE